MKLILVIITLRATYIPMFAYRTDDKKKFSQIVYSNGLNFKTFFYIRQVFHNIQLVSKCVGERIDFRFSDFVCSTMDLLRQAGLREARD